MRIKFGTKKPALDDVSDSNDPMWSEALPSELAPQYAHPLYGYPSEAAADWDQPQGAVPRAEPRWRRSAPDAAADFDAPPERPFRSLHTYERSRGSLLWLYAATGIAALFVGVYASRALVSQLIAQTSKPLPRQSVSREDPPELVLSGAIASDAAGAHPQGLTPEGAAAARPTVRAAKPARAPVAARTRVRAAARDVESVPIDPKAVPDMDLMNIPSSPMEREALARAHGGSPLSYDSAAIIEAQAARDPMGKLDILHDPGVETGTLRLNSRPWSQVFIDDRPVGTTPLLAIRLSSGQHKVRLVNEQFGLSKSLDIEVEAGESISRIVSFDR